MELFEGVGRQIRCSLARLKRKTHSYSKSKINLAASILLFIVRKCGGELPLDLQTMIKSIVGTKDIVPAATASQAGLRSAAELEFSQRL